METKQKAASAIAGASVVLTLLGFLSKGVGFIREIIYANNFGLSSEFDLFLSSIALPNVINTSIIYLAQHYFVPGYNKIKNDSESDAIDFFNYTFWRFIVGGIVLAGVLYIASGAIFHSYLGSISPDKQELGINIFNMFLVTIPLNAGMSIIMAYQQAKFKFSYPAISLILLNIIVIIMVLLFSELLEILVLPISFVIAYSAAFIFLVVLVKENFRSLSFETLKLKYKTAEIKTILFLIVIEGSSLSYVLIDRYFISEVSVGGIAALNYAFVIYSLPISLFSIPLITTLFSKFSSSTHTLKSDFRSGYGMIFFIMIPFMFIFYFWGDIFLSLFYERGKFTSSDTSLTYSVLQNFSFSLLFISTYQLMVKIFYSLNKYFLILAISLAAVVIKYFLNFWLVGLFEQDGLALSTTFVYAFLFISGISIIAMKFEIVETKQFVMRLLFFLICALTAYFVTNTFILFLNINQFYSSVIMLISFVSIYLLNSFVTRINEFALINSTIGILLRIKK
jgi:putative peptidoglycan lipid II flippase